MLLRESGKDGQERELVRNMKKRGEWDRKGIAIDV
jgi:hypothetical protein